VAWKEGYPTRTQWITGSFQRGWLSGSLKTQLIQNKPKRLLLATPKVRVFFFLASWARLQFKLIINTESKLSVGEEQRERGKYSKRGAIS